MPPVDTMNPMMAALLAGGGQTKGPSDIEERMKGISALLDKLGIDSADQLASNLASRRQQRGVRSRENAIGTGLGMLLSTIAAGASGGGTSAAFNAGMPGIQALNSIADVNQKAENKDLADYHMGLKNYFDSVTKLYDETRPAGITWADVEETDASGKKTTRKVGLQPQPDGTVKQYPGPTGVVSNKGSFQWDGNGQLNWVPQGGEPPTPVQGVAPRQTPQEAEAARVKAAEKSKYDADRLKEQEQLDADYTKAGQMEAEKKSLEAALAQYQKDQTHPKQKSTWKYDETTGPPTTLTVPSGSAGGTKVIDNPALEIWRKWVKTKRELDSMHGQTIPDREKKLGRKPKSTGKNFFTK